MRTPSVIGVLEDGVGAFDAVVSLEKGSAGTVVEISRGSISSAVEAQVSSMDGIVNTVIVCWCASGGGVIIVETGPKRSKET